MSTQLQSSYHVFSSVNRCKIKRRDLHAKAGSIPLPLVGVIGDAARNKSINDNMQSHLLPITYK